MEGPLRTPGVELSGTFASLGYEDNRIKGLSLKAALPDVTKPLTADASLVVGELKTGGRTFQNLSAAITTQSRALQANVRTAGDVVLGLSLAGTVDEDQEGLAVSAMTLAWPEATWTLQGPTPRGLRRRPHRGEARPHARLGRAAPLRDAGEAGRAHGRARGRRTRWT